MGKQIKEQPLPPNGCCLLGSFNLTKYIEKNEYGTRYFNFERFKEDIPVVVRAMDNVIDRTIYPLEQQRNEEINKRRMGIGLTGVANAIEALGYPYGSTEFLIVLESIFTTLRNECYLASVDLAIEKGPFPLFSTKLLESEFAKTLPEHIRDSIRAFGLRNSHLLSIAPTGTISLSADNISSGIEPVFNYSYERTVQTYNGEIKEKIEDYGLKTFGVKGKTTDKLSVMDHVNVLNLSSNYVDSACSKTCNIGDEVSWEEFKEVYMSAYEGGASGCTTFRPAGERYGILNASKDEEIVEEEPKGKDEFIEEDLGGACFFDPSTGLRTCE